jgi:Cytochrome c oxidase subunit IV
VSEIDQQTAPVGEEVHLPGPSLLPLLSAVAVTLMVVGLTIGWYLSIIGVILFVVTMVMWIRDTRGDVDSLPEEHH